MTSGAFLPQYWQVNLSRLKTSKRRLEAEARSGGSWRLWPESSLPGDPGSREGELCGQHHWNLRRLKAATSSASSLNHSPCIRFEAKRPCQYASIPSGSSVLIS
jgi:hypothetical protein